MPSPLHIVTDTGYAEAVAQRNRLADAVRRFDAAIADYENRMPVDPPSVWRRFWAALYQFLDNRTICFAVGVIVGVVYSLL